VGELCGWRDVADGINVCDKEIIARTCKNHVVHGGVPAEILVTVKSDSYCSPVALLYREWRGIGFRSPGRDCTCHKHENN